MEKKEGTDPSVGSGGRFVGSVLVSQFSNYGLDSVRPQVGATREDPKHVPLTITTEKTPPIGPGLPNFRMPVRTAVTNRILALTSPLLSTPTSWPSTLEFHLCPTRAAPT